MYNRKIGDNMTVKDALPVMKSILGFKKTPITIQNPHGMIIVQDTRGEAALAALESSISDEANHDQDVVQCRNCGFVVSILLTIDGCPYCGCLRLDQDLNGLVA